MSCCVSLPYFYNEIRLMGSYKTFLPLFNYLWNIPNVYKNASVSCLQYRIAFDLNCNVLAFSHDIFTCCERTCRFLTLISRNVSQAKTRIQRFYLNLLLTYRNIYILHWKLSKSPQQVKAKFGLQAVMISIMLWLHYFLERHFKGIIIILLNFSISRKLGLAMFVQKILLYTWGQFMNHKYMEHDLRI